MLRLQHAQQADVADGAVSASRCPLLRCLRGRPLCRRPRQTCHQRRTFASTLASIVASILSTALSTVAVCSSCPCTSWRVTDHTDARRGGGCVGGGGGERASRPASHPHCAALWLSTLVPAPAEFRIRKSQTSRQSLPAPPPHPPSPRA